MSRRRQSERPERHEHPDLLVLVDPAFRGLLDGSSGNTERDRAWRRVYPPLVRLLGGLLRHRLRVLRLPDGAAEVAELAQAVLVRMLERHALGRCRARDWKSLLGYLRAICDSVIYDALRRKRARSPVLEVAEERWRYLTETVPDPGPLPDRRTLERQAMRLLAREARSVAARPADRLVLKLALVEGRSSPEVSRRLGRSLSPGAIDCRVFRLRRRLLRRGIRLPARGF